MKNMKKTICTLGLIAVTATAYAADSVDVKVIGTISPAACAPTLGGGGTVDYGTIKANALAADDYTTLAVKTVSLSITCDAPAKVGIHVLNGRPGTTAGAAEGGPMSSALAPVALLDIPAGQYPVVGLGADGTSDIGGYGIGIVESSLKVDGNAVDLILTDMSDRSRYTMEDVDYPLYDPNNDSLFTWAAPGTLTPVAFTTMAGTLNVQAYLNKASELDLTKEVQLDGLTTIEIVYL